MAFDGLTVAALVNELNNVCKDGRISKITEPERDEILLTIKAGGNNYRLLISASASLPLMYMTEENKVSPITAPNFCMVLRKHLSGGRILEITQPGLERVVVIKVEHLDEMGDLVIRHLNVELMGKHSNIILTDSNNVILDSLKRVSGMVSSVREVLPGREYFIPNTMDKADPVEVFKEGKRSEFARLMSECYKELSKAIYTTFTGISPAVAAEIVYASGILDSKQGSDLDSFEMDKLYDAMEAHMDCVINHEYHPTIVLNNGKPKEYFVTRCDSYNAGDQVSKDTVSSMLYTYYRDKNASDNMRQKTMDLKHHITTILEKDYKKLDLQNKQLKDAESKDKYKLYGELITAYGYAIEDGAREATVNNYYTGEDIKIPLDNTKTPMENAKKYYDKYNKLKRTEVALQTQTKITRDEIDYLEQIVTYIDIAGSEDDIKQVRAELREKGYVKKTSQGKGKDKAPKVSIEHLKYKEYDIYIGKNNIQNEEVTFKIATGNDWWFHAKNIPGSHVVVKADWENQATEWDMPDDVFEAAATLAAHFSKNKSSEKVEIDYTRKKHIKKTPGGEKGYVIYETNYSMTIGTDISKYKFEKC